MATLSGRIHCGDPAVLREMLADLAGVQAQHPDLEVSVTVEPEPFADVEEDDDDEEWLPSRGGGGVMPQAYYDLQEGPPTTEEIAEGAYMDTVDQIL